MDKAKEPQQEKKYHPRYRLKYSKNLNAWYYFEIINGYMALDYTHLEFIK
jgi:hypothetical protein